MGNAVPPCFKPCQRGPVKLVFWGGNTRYLSKKKLAGELMLAFPEWVVCHGDSFYIGPPLPVLSIDDVLLKGHTYFVLPVDHFPCHKLTAASLACLSPSPKPSIAGAGQCPFEYVKDADGRSVIKVSSNFITKAMTSGNEAVAGGGNGAGLGGGGPLCSTPELQKHYTQLVGFRESPWSPKLETISEKKTRSSPARLLISAYHLVEKIV